jgi:CheY-like chemotaxis protein
MDGLEVLRTLKKDPETTQIPIVMMTSSKEEQDIINSYNLGVNSFVIKPVGFEEFSKAVSELGMYWMLLNETSDNK